MKTIIVMLVAALLGSQIIKAQGNLVINGGFDTDASGWMLANATYSSSTFGNPSGCVVLADNSMLSQQINSLTPGQLYLVSGSYSGKYIGVLSVEIDNTLLFETNTAPQNYMWYGFSSYYTATSTSAFLAVQGSAVLDHYAIDNLSIIAVPEPAAGALLGMGGLALLCQRRKTKAG